MMYIKITDQCATDESLAAEPTYCDRHIIERAVARPCIRQSMMGSTREIASDAVRALYRHHSRINRSLHCKPCTPQKCR